MLIFDFSNRQFVSLNNKVTGARKQFLDYYRVQEKEKYDIFLFFFFF